MKKEINYISKYSTMLRTLAVNYKPLELEDSIRNIDWASIAKFACVGAVGAVAIAAAPVVTGTALFTGVGGAIGFLSTSVPVYLGSHGSIGLTGYLFGKSLCALGMASISALSVAGIAGLMAVAPAALIASAIATTAPVLTVSAMNALLGVTIGALAYAGYLILKALFQKCKISAKGFITRTKREIIILRDGCYDI